MDNVSRLMFEQLKHSRNASLSASEVSSNLSLKLEMGSKLQEEEHEGFHHAPHANHATSL